MSGLLRDVKNVTESLFQFLMRYGVTKDMLFNIFNVRPDTSSSPIHPDICNNPNILTPPFGGVRMLGLLQMSGLQGTEVLKIE